MRRYHYPLLLMLCLAFGCPSTPTGDDDASADDDDAHDDDDVTSDDDDSGDDDDATGDDDDTTGDDDDDTPEDVCVMDPCGGDVVGTWDMRNVCGYPVENPYLADCPNSVFNVIWYSDAVITFDADGSYERTGDERASVSTMFPPACMETLGFETCADVDDALYGGKAGCFDIPDGCVCGGKFVDERPVDSSGTWTTNGNTLTLDDGTGSPVTYDYCVAGNILQADVPGGPYLSVFQLQ